MNLERLLESVGKQIFIKYYDYFQNIEKYSNLDIIEIIEEDFTKKSKISRTAHARTIFKNNWQIDALNNILISKVSEETILLCQKILKNENQKILQEVKNSEIKETEKQALVKIRLGHSKLRENILGNKKVCEICGISHKKLLIVSHIKPWVKSNDFEKLDKENVLLLCNMHDALFDKGLISFKDNGEILISSDLTENNQKLVNINQNIKIKILSEKQKKYLKFHRENIFIE